MNLVKRLQAHVVARSLVEPKGALLLAVSGGLDSVTMLDLFYRLRDNLQLRLGVVHVHHGIRGSEADRDLTFVRQLAAHYDLAFFERRVDAPGLAKREGYSLEESARMLRYACFEDILQATEFSELATAHTADDRAETILYQLLRGSGLLGLRGMPERRDPFVRPLLSFRRSELAAYARERKLRFVEDSTNEKLDYKRNRIRRELIPYLEEHFNPNLIETLNRTGGILAENEAYLTASANEIFPQIVLSRKKQKIILEIDRFLNYFIILRKYLLYRAFEEVGIRRYQIDFGTLQRTLEVIDSRKIGKRVLLAEDAYLQVDRDGIVIGRGSQPGHPVDFTVSDTGRMRFEDWLFRWQILDRQAFAGFNPDPRVEAFDVEKTGSRLRVRRVQPGDRFVPLNFSGHKKVADFLAHRKVPLHERREVPVLESGREIVWVCGHGIDDRFKVTESTHRILKMQMQTAEG